MNMKTYYQMTKAERLALTNEELSDAVKVTAIEAGITPPMKYSEALNAAGYSGFRLTGNVAKFYEIEIPGQYNPVGSGIAFSTEEEAERFLSEFNVHSVTEDGYGDTKKTVIKVGELSIKARFISPSSAQSYGSSVEKVQQFDSDDMEEKYEKFCEDLQSDHAELRQETFNAQARWEKRQEYLRLANGDESVAKAFWGKAESGEFPPAEEPELKIK